MKSLVVALLVAAAGVAVHAQEPLGALAPANLNKPRPAAPFDITGTWLNDIRFKGSWRFGPPPRVLTTARSIT